MSKKIFTEKEMKALSGNPYVKSVSSKGIAIFSLCAQKR